MTSQSQTENQTSLQKGSVKMQKLQAAEHLKKNFELIKARWEDKVREEVLESKGTSSFVLVNSLGVFLSELAMIIKEDSSIPERLSEGAMSKIHGGDRAEIHAYALPQLLKEYSIVREVIIEELSSHGVLTEEIHSIIDKTIDTAISAAAAEFEKVRVEKMESALSKAESSNRDLEQFALVAAHDLNSPLATVTSLLDLLRGELGPQPAPESLEYIGYMKETLGRMRSLIGNLLEYARLTRAPKPFQKISMNEVLLAAQQNLADSIQKAGAQVEANNLPSVIGDFDLLVQVFQNLISNSIKYRGPEAPVIKVKAKEKDLATWLFSVQDNGVGFEEKQSDEIFSLYKRLQNKSDLPGAGIGLATCRKVIELHGGRIWAESRPHQGSTFFFTLPKIDNTGFH